MKIDGIVLAVEDMAAMVAFYNEVFDAGLVPINETSSFHRGSFAGLPIVLCPNEIAEVDADQSRVQWRLRVDDASAVAAATQRCGGTVTGENTDHRGREFSIADPDGNTYEITQ